MCCSYSQHSKNIILLLKVHITNTYKQLLGLSIKYWIYTIFFPILYKVHANLGLMFRLTTETLIIRKVQIILYTNITFITNTFNLIIYFSLIKKFREIKINSFTGKLWRPCSKEIQSTLCICEFYICRVNKLHIENIQTKFQKVPKSKT